MAHEGLGSRRAIEKLISSGLVEVNGQKAHIGQRIDQSSRVVVDGRKVRFRSRNTTDVIVLNKSVGTVSTRRDEKGRATIYKNLSKPPHGRWISVGRLDINTSGLILLTNNGELANRMMPPSSAVDKEYAVRVSGRLSDEELETLRDGVEIDGERLKFSDIQFFGGTNRNNWYHVVLMDGKNREVRNLFEYVGLSVSRLKRVRFGPLVLPSSLKVGQHLVLSEEDTEALCVLFGIDYKSGVSSKKRNNEKSSKSLLIPYPELNF